MPLIIDGNNLLHATKPRMFAGLDERGLCLALAKSPWSRGRITLVCDGQPGPLGLVESPVSCVELIYSGRRIADEVIIDRINADSAPRRLTVVSTDHEIRQAARRRRARSWTSEQFLSRLAASLGRAAPAAPPPGEDKPAGGGLPSREVNRWLEEFGFGEAAEDRDEERGHEGEDDESPYWPLW